MTTICFTFPQQKKTILYHLWFIEDSLCETWLDAILKLYFTPYKRNEYSEFAQVVQVVCLTIFERKILYTAQNNRHLILFYR